MTEPSNTTQSEAATETSQQTDAELVRRLAIKDVKAMSILYDRYSAIVHGLAFRITGHAGDAAEVVQETFTQVWRQADHYVPQRGSVIGWLCTIARTRALDLVRLRARRPRLEGDCLHSEPHPDPLGAESTTPEANLLADEASQAIRVAIASLSKVERTALELAYYEDLSHSEIATRTGLPLGTVKTHISRAIRKLRQVVDAFQVEEASRT